MLYLVIALVVIAAVPLIEGIYEMVRPHLGTLSMDEVDRLVEGLRVVGTELDGGKAGGFYLDMMTPDRSFVATYRVRDGHERFTIARAKGRRRGPQLLLTRERGVVGIQLGPNEPYSDRVSQERTTQAHRIFTLVCRLADHTYA